MNKKQQGVIEVVDMLLPKLHKLISNKEFATTFREVVDGHNFRLVPNLEVDDSLAIVYDGEGTNYLEVDKDLNIKKIKITEGTDGEMMINELCKRIVNEV